MKEQDSGFVPELPGVALQAAPSSTEDMVERAAMAIFRHCAAERAGSLEPDWDDMEEPRRDYWREFARTALEAMREPTEAMVRAANRINPCQSAEGQCYSEASIYRAMIDAALSPSPPTERDE